MENAKKKLIMGLFQTSLFPAVILAGWFYYPVMEKGPVFCLFRNFVGVKCYGCGMTRAVCEVAHGHVAAAMQQNKLVIPLLTVLFILSYVGAMNLWKMHTKRDVVSDSAGARPVVNLSTQTRPRE